MNKFRRGRDASGNKWRDEVVPERHGEVVARVRAATSTEREPLAAVLAEEGASRSRSVAEDQSPTRIGELPAPRSFLNGPIGRCQSRLLSRP